LADMTLPPMQMRRSLTERVLAQSAAADRHASQQSRGHRIVALPSEKCAGAGNARQIAGIASPMLNACQGDFCDLRIPYPASLQDLESSSHPWMIQARELCRCTSDRNNSNTDGERDKESRRDSVYVQKRLGNLMCPEEIAACLEGSSMEGEAGKPTAIHASSRGCEYGMPADQEKLCTAASFGSAGDIQASWIFEGRAYPRLCKWLETEANWMVDPNDADQVANASVHFHEDENAAGGPPKFLAHGVLHGVRHRLRTVPVCGTCFCIYNTIHSAVVMMRVQHRDGWARRAQQSRRRQNEREKKEKLERLLFSETRGDGRHFNVSRRRSSSLGALERTIVRHPVDEIEDAEDDARRSLPEVFPIRPLTAA